MKKLLTCLFVMCFATVLCFSDENIQAKSVAQELQEVSVTLLAKNNGDRSTGSGTLITRKMPNGDRVNFIWTVAHCLEILRMPQKVIDVATGFPKTIVDFEDCLVVRHIREDGRYVGKTEFQAEVIRYDRQEDLALLRVRKKNYSAASVRFCDDKELVPLGKRVFHVGSLHGELGSNSMTEGLVSQHGRISNRKVFDQIAVVAFPGSSGGGVFLEDGRMMGMLAKGIGETWQIVIPSRRIKEWSKKSKVEWAFDGQIPMVSEEELRKMPIEENGLDIPSELPSLDKILPSLEKILPGLKPGPPGKTQ